MHIILSSSHVNNTLPGFRSRCNIDLSCCHSLSIAWSMFLKKRDNTPKSQTLHDIPKQTPNLLCTQQMNSLPWRIHILPLSYIPIPFIHIPLHLLTIFRRCTLKCMKNAYACRTGVASKVWLDSCVGILESTMRDEGGGGICGKWHFWPSRKSMKSSRLEGGSTVIQYLCGEKGLVHAHLPPLAHCMRTLCKYLNFVYGM